MTQPSPREAAPTAAKSLAGGSALWSVLTDEERAFFLGADAIGPVSYGRTGAVQSGVTPPVGQRIDARA